MTQAVVLSARKKMMDLLAQREHSEKELREKLLASFPGEAYAAAIDEAIAYGKKKKWLASPRDLAEKWADQLHRRYKGILYINNYLEEKGLPAVSVDDHLELEKARHLVKNKYLEAGRLSDRLSEVEKARLVRFLATRGFAEDTVSQLLENEMKNDRESEM